MTSALGVAVALGTPEFVAATLDVIDAVGAPSGLLPAGSALPGLTVGNALVLGPVATASPSLEVPPEFVQLAIPPVINAEINAHVSARRPLLASIIDSSWVQREDPGRKRTKFASFVGGG